MSSSFRQLGSSSSVRVKSQFEVVFFVFLPWLNICLCLPGETIKIIIEEYVQHLSGYLFKLKFDPSLLFKEQFHYSNRIAVEFVHLYHWHSLMPDSFLINGDDVPYSQFLHNNSLLIHYGVEKLVDSFSRQPAGQVAKLITLLKMQTLRCWWRI